MDFFHERMMIMFSYISGDILNSSAKCLVNTVNCEGYMGKGIAYQFKLRFPLNNKDYISACHKKTLYIGTIHTFEEDGKIIINFPTKDKWRGKTKIEYIHKGMKKLVEYLKINEIKSIAIPPLGCGNGGLKWSEVKPIIISYLEPFKDNIDIQIYEPNDFSSARIAKNPVKPKLSHIILMLIMSHLSTKLKTQLQKAAFLFNIISHSNYFKFERNKFEPYDHSIEIISKEILELQNYYKLDIDQCIKFCKQQLTSKNFDEKLKFYQPFIITATNFVNEFSDLEGLEIVSSVCFLIQESPKNFEEIVNELKNLSERKAILFSSEHVERAIQYLMRRNLIEKNLLGQYSIK